MSFSLSFDLASANSDDRCRIGLGFERCGWQAFGGTSVRYPAVGKNGEPNDFFGQVLPALWYFRSLVIAKAINVKSYLFEADAEALYRHDDCVGHAILPVADLRLLPSAQRDSRQKKLSESRFRSVLQASELVLA